MTETSEHPQGEDERKHVFDDPKNVVRVRVTLYVLCLIFFLLDFVVHRHSTFYYHKFEPEMWMGFYAIYGFVSCVVLVLLATAMRKAVMRKEDYYDG